MIGYVIEGGRGRRSLVFLLAALAAATIGVYLVTMTAAKPAEAVSCSNGAIAPKASDDPYDSGWAADDIL
jgi:hypothetical protein